MKKIATRLRAVPYGDSGALYYLTPPLWGHAYVVVSSAFVLLEGDETLIFPSNAAGTVGHWAELPGSFQGAQDHAAALLGAGYALAPLQRPKFGRGGQRKRGRRAHALSREILVRRAALRSRRREIEALLFDIDGEIVAQRRAWGTWGSRGKYVN